MKIEMHVHTSEGSPCAKADAESIVRAYRDAGYDGIVVTNHFDSRLLKEFGRCDQERIERYLLGYRKAKAVESKYGVRVLLGVEIRLEPDEEDFLIYGIDEAFLFSYPDINWKTQQELYELCEARGALLFQAHPFREPCRPRDAEFLHGVEINQNPHSENRNELLSLWLKEHPQLALVSGSDCHDLDQAGFGGIQTDEAIGDEKDLAHTLRQRKYRLIRQNG